MPVNDKAVSTEDLCAEDVGPALGILRLEDILTTLVENKVEALKQDHGKSSSVHSSPKRILQKFKCYKSPKATLKVENEIKKDSKRKDKKEKIYRVVSENRQFKRQVLRQETSSPDSQILHVDESTKYSGNVTPCKSPSCLEPSCQSHICYCNRGPGLLHANDDYISIKMDGYGDIETGAIIAREELRRARRKRRRRRKRRLKKRLALNPHLVDTLAQDNESFKVLQDDELPPRAKWTIVATACLLLFMCLLLVGITLRMAPLIDEIGSKKLKRTASLEEIYTNKKKLKNRKNETRRKSEQISRENVIGIHRKSSSKKLRKKHSTRSRASRCSSSYTGDIEKGYSDSNPLERPRLSSNPEILKAINSKRLSRQLSSQLSKEDGLRQRRRKKIINIILAVYLFLFCISILSVVITLTHQTTATVSDNKNMREENEKLLNSLSGNYSVTSVQNGVSGNRNNR